MELLITFLAGASVLIGAAVVRLPDQQKRIAHLSMAVALGALLSLLIFDLLPELSEVAEAAGWMMPLLLTAAGIGLLRFLDHFIPEHDDHEHNHDTGNALHIGLMSSLAVILHNIVEGMTVYTLSCSDLRQGMIFAAGIALHNIPVGLLICSTLKYGSISRQAGVFCVVTLSTFAGGILMFLLSGQISDTVTGALISLATGMILYLVFWELLPHVLRTRTYLLNVFGTAAGFLLVYISTLIAE